MNLVGDAITAAEATETGLANAMVPDHELFDVALLVGAQARRLRRRSRSSRSSRSRRKPDLDEGIEAEKEGFATAFLSEDAREGISAFLAKRKPHWKGK